MVTLPKLIKQRPNLYVYKIEKYILSIIVILSTNEDILIQSCLMRIFILIQFNLNKGVFVINHKQQIPIAHANEDNVGCL